MLNFGFVAHAGIATAALACCLSRIFSENRLALFRIMLSSLFRSD
jgi:hypothetical protein